MSLAATSEPRLELPGGTESAAPGDFRQLFDAHFDYVCRSLRRLGVTQRDLEDAAQETFIALHRRLDGFDPSRPARPWVFAFALRVAANFRRKRTQEPDDALDELPSAAPSPEQAAIAGQARNLVLRALDSVPAERREVLVMHELEGFAAPEISELLGVPVNTVYSRLRVARAEFERSLNRLTASQEGR